ncbi:MAG: Rpn family recombination-promoting nuclease/putative transposase [Treponema sp.]|nr:Rpn family recombination-promoting nuclease/putative transposase [Treponema sp.]
MKANTKFKSSVFSLLFSDPDVLRELYCALKGLSLPDDVPVVINTLDDVLFMDQLNDISFEIGGRLVVLIEHQSTINPNMALRLLMYIGRIYEKIVEDKNIYSKKQIYIPQPEFFVLYNGIDPFPDEDTFKLSDLFMDIEPLGLPEKANPVLELEVKVLNINEGKNEAIVNKCRFLSQYSAFTAKVREFKNGGYSLQEAIKKAVVYCRDHDILKEFLEKQASEVLSMLMTEWNMDDALAVRYEEGHEEGMEKGEKKGREDVARNAMAEGVPMELITKITGLDMETVKRLASE